MENEDWMNDLLTNLTESANPIPDIPDIEYQNNDNFQQITREEIVDSLKNKKESTPGHDEITNNFLKNLPEKHIDFLAIILNKIINEEMEIPEDWKQQIILPILKPNKNPQEYTSYRPISLSSCVGKLLESIIKARIEYEIESKKKFSDLQNGFRRGRSALENCLYLSTEIYKAFTRGEKVIALFLDVSAAYDNVQVPILLNYLNELNINNSIIKFIKKMLNNRKVCIRSCTSGKQSNFRFTSRGLLQGSPLSPLLFNIYMMGLDEFNSNKVNILQFADDILIISSGKNIQMCINNIQERTNRINMYLNNHGLTVSAVKTKGIIFSKGAVRNLPQRIRINHVPVEWVSQYKYLGITFDPQMRWSAHIDSCVAKATRGINVMKSLTRVWWGADPKTLLIIYKGLVRTHLDFGMQCIFKTSKANWNKLNNTQYQALRVITGCMKSTPIRVLLSETSEMPLELRRVWLSAKAVSKILARSDDKILTQILSFYNLFNLEPHYWQRLIPPSIMEGLDHILKYLNLIYRSDKLPCFQTPYNKQVYKIEYIKLSLSKDTDNSKKFINMINEIAPDAAHIFTDASVDPSTKSCGIGIYSPNPNIRISRKLSDYTSICSAETLAIREAVRSIREHTNNFNIISDSLSALQALSRTGIDKNQDYITLSTKSEIIEASERGNVRLVWVPSHTGITGNDMADQLACIGRNQVAIRQNNQVPYSTFLNCIKEIIWKNWEEMYLNWPLGKGSYYADIQSKPLKTPWFYNIRYKNRIMITSIIRMRSNHCCVPSHLNKIGVKDSPNCECGEYGNLDHIIFNCQRRRQQGISLYLKAAQEMKGPVNMKSILASPTSKLMQNIIQDLHKEGIKL